MMDSIIYSPLMKNHSNGSPQWVRPITYSTAATSLGSLVFLGHCTHPEQQHMWLQCCLFRFIYFFHSLTAHVHTALFKVFPKLLLFLLLGSVLHKNNYLQISRWKLYLYPVVLPTLGKYNEACLPQLTTPYLFKCWQSTPTVPLITAIRFSVEIIKEEKTFSQKVLNLNWGLQYYFRWITASISFHVILAFDKLELRSKSIKSKRRILYDAKDYHS